MEKEDNVKDLNLEARIDKELLLRGFRRRDFDEEELLTLKTELEALNNGNCSVLNGFWENHKDIPKTVDNPDVPPKPKFSVGDRVWVTENIAVNGIPGVGVVRKVETEWIDLGETLNGYWEIAYQLKNLRVPFTEDHVFATELEALAAMASDFRKNAIKQAATFCRRMRALGMNITTRELLENITDFL